MLIFHFIAQPGKQAQVQCLCCSKIDHLHSLIQNYVQRQVFGGSGALQWRKEYMNLSCWGHFFNFCQKTAKLLTHSCTVLQSSHTVLFAAISTAVYILCKDSQTQELLHNSRFWHTPYVHKNLHKEMVLVMMVLSEEQEEQLRCMRAGEVGSTGSSGVEAVWLKWEGLSGDGAAPQGWGCSSAARTPFNWVQPIQ